MICQGGWKLIISENGVGDGVATPTLIPNG